MALGVDSGVQIRKDSGGVFFWGLFFLGEVRWTPFFAVNLGGDSLSLLFHVFAYFPLKQPLKEALRN